MNIDTGQFKSLEEMRQMDAAERDRYVPVPRRFAGAAVALAAASLTAFPAMGGGVERHPLARMAKQARRDKTRASKAARKSRHR